MRVCVVNCQWLDTASGAFNPKPQYSPCVCVLSTVSGQCICGVGHVCVCVCFCITVFISFYSLCMFFLVITFLSPVCVVSLCGWPLVRVLLKGGVSTFWSGKRCSLR